MTVAPSEVDELEIWTYRTTVVLEPAVDLTDFNVEAKDGSIGKVDESAADAGKSHIVVDTGPWIFGRKVILPAQTVERVDLDNRVVYVDRTKEASSCPLQAGEGSPARVAQSITSSASGGTASAGGLQSSFANIRW
jgi:hypothetical protein